jgi:hypothetical protein
VTEAWRSIEPYSHALLGSWWTVAFAILSGWGVIVFLEPQFASVLPPQITWGVALFCWIAAPFRAFHRMRLESARSRPEPEVSPPTTNVGSNISFNTQGAAGPVTASVIANGMQISVTVQAGVPVDLQSAPPAVAAPAPVPPRELPPPAVEAPPPGHSAPPPQAAEPGAPASEPEPDAAVENEGGGEITLEEEPPGQIQGEGA